MNKLGTSAGDCRACQAEDGLLCRERQRFIELARGTLWWIVRKNIGENLCWLNAPGQ